MAWKARQGPMRSVFDKGKGKGASNPSLTPREFQGMAQRFIQALLSELGANEVRAMAANKAASPCLQVHQVLLQRGNVLTYYFQMLLEVEADQDLSDAPGSLMDRVTVGIISSCSKYLALFIKSAYITCEQETERRHRNHLTISIHSCVTPHPPIYLRRLFLVLPVTLSMCYGSYISKENFHVSLCIP
jgi:hypothetical protein